jgi:hypothetical protein
MSSKRHLVRKYSIFDLLSASHNGLQEISPLVSTLTRTGTFTPVDMGPISRNVNADGSDAQFLAQLINQGIADKVSIS